MILHETTGPQDWKAHLAQPEKQWRAGYSAMETANAWHTGPGMPLEIAQHFPGAQLLQAIVEYPVPLPGGHTDSMNDVFALMSDAEGLTVCMVEAKRNEPFGDALKDWLKNESPGKTQRLGFLCDTLGLTRKQCDESLRYQLFHRTASAILTARRFHAKRAVMLVQSFSAEKNWFDDYAAFAALFGITAQADSVQNVPGERETPLSLGWVTSPLTTKEIM